MKKQMSLISSQPFLYFLVVVMFLNSATVTILSILNNTGTVHFFNNTAPHVYAKYATDLNSNPIGVWIVWLICFTWNTAYTLYLVASLGLPSYKSPVKTIPTLTPQTFLLSYIGGCGAMIGYTFTIDRELITTSFVLLAIASGLLCKATRISLHVTYDYLSSRSTKIQINGAMIWLVRMLLQNGVAFFATLITGDVFQLLAMTLIYDDSYGKPEAKLRGGYTIEQGSTVALALLLSAVIVFIVQQNIIHRRLYRYIISIMPALVAYFANIVAKLLEDGNRNRNFQIAAAGLGICSIVAVTRITIFIVMIVKKYAKSSFEPLKDEKSSISSFQV